VWSSFLTLSETQIIFYSKEDGKRAAKAGSRGIHQLFAKPKPGVYPFFSFHFPFTLLYINPKGKLVLI